MVGNNIKRFKAGRPRRLVPALHFVSSVVLWKKIAFWRLPLERGVVSTLCNSKINSSFFYTIFALS